MVKWFAWLGLLAVGVAAGLTIGKLTLKTPTQHDTPAVAPIAVVAPVERLSSEVAQAQRADRYAEIASIADMLRLPTDFARNEALFALAGRTDAVGLKLLIREAAGIDTRHERNVALQILFSRYTEIDPPGAVEFARRLDIGGYRLVFIEEIFSSWARVDLNAALGAAATLHSSIELQAAGSGILRAFQAADESTRAAILARLPDSYRPVDVRARSLSETAAQAPEKAAREALTLTNRAERQTALRAVAYVWAQQDPHAALAFAEGIADMQSRWHFQYSVIHRWAQTDAEGALSVLQEMPQNRRKSQMISTVLTEFANQDPLRSLEVARNLPAGVEKWAREQAVYTAWALNDFESAWAHTESIANRSSRHEIRGTIAGRFGKENPAGALAWLASLDATGDTWMMDHIVTAAATSDPVAAFNYVAGIEDESRRHRIMTSVVFRVSDTKPELALEYMDSLPPGARTDVIQSVAMGKASENIDGALAWTETLQPGERRQAMTGIMNRWASNDPEAAMLYLERMHPADRRPHVSIVAQGLAQQDPQRAYEWLTGLGENETAGRVIYDIALQWAQRDPPAAANAMRDISDTPWGSRATTSSVRAWAQSDPLAAAQWTLNLPDGELKRDAMNAAVAQWANYSMSAATAWVDNLRGPARDGAVAGLSGNTTIPLDVALEFANSVQDAELRLRTLSELVLRAWEQDPAMVDSVLNRTNLHPPEREMLQRLLEVR